MTYLLVSHHDFSSGGIDVWRGKLFVNVSAVVVRQRILEPPCCPIFDVEDAANALITKLFVVPQLVQRSPVQTLPVVDDTPVR